MKRFFLLLLSIVTVIALSSCKAAEPADVIGLSVHIEEDGTILIDGRPGSLEDVRQRLVTVQKDRSVVRYSRANPAADPPPNAMDVLAAIAEANVPVQLEERAATD